MKTLQLEVRALTTYEVAPDGSTFRIDLIDADGESVSLIIPVECLQQLALTMPKIVAEAITDGSDPPIRIVSAVTSLKLERAQDGIAALLTVATRENFIASYALSEVGLTRIMETVSDYELEAFPFGLTSR